MKIEMNIAKTITGDVSILKTKDAIILETPRQSPMVISRKGFFGVSNQGVKSHTYPCNIHTDDSSKGENNPSASELVVGCTHLLKAPGDLSNIYNKVLRYFCYQYTTFSTKLI